MRISKLLIGGMIAAGASPAFAADAGWGIQFYHDAFSDMTLPMAIMAEKTEGFSVDYANVFLACDGKGSVAFLFQPERYEIGFNDTISGKFRGADGVDDYTFKLVDLPAFGKHFAVTGSDAKKLLATFETASQPVPYQTDAKTGTFPIIGFTDAEKVVAGYCSELK